MTNCTTKILIQPISLTSLEFFNIKREIAACDWGMLLESADATHIDSRWSIYSGEPIATLQTFAGKTTLWQNELNSQYEGDPFEILQTVRTTLFHKQTLDTDLPFIGGALGYLAYELGSKPRTHANKLHDLHLPEMAIGFYDWALLYDNQHALFYLVVHKTKNTIQNIQALWQDRFDWLIYKSKTPLPQMPFKLDSNWSANMDKQAYKDKFNHIQNYILSGDCYQVNLTQRFQADYQGDEFQAYQALLADNRPPFAAFLRFPAHAILSLSPERFLKSQQGFIQSKPIKGTTPRFKNLQLDDESRQTLLASEKDRSENLMIVDLMRNDIGRVCQVGSICVPKLFDIESFPAVHHLVSTVTGQLAKNHSSEDLLRACFPGGSITGAPKIRAMEIIAELEPTDRKIYCGCIGYINGNGDMDMNISIRTLLCHKQKIYCWAGGGLVADSNAEQEYQECFDKVSKILPSLEALNKNK